MVTWSTYLSGVGAALLIYYFFVLVVFFRKEMLRKFKPVVASSSIVSPLLAAETNVQEVQAAGGVQSLVDEIEAYITDVEVDISARELLIGISRVIRKHSSVETPGLRSSINRVIAEMVVMRLSIELSDEQLSELWK